MKLYHGTSIENKEKILEEGFKTTYGNYGECLYLAVDKDLAYDYGDEIIEVEIEDEFIKEMCSYETETSIGSFGLEEIAFKNDYAAIKISYPEVKSSKDYTEVCVYDLSVVNILF